MWSFFRLLSNLFKKIKNEKNEMLMMYFAQQSISIRFHKLKCVMKRKWYKTVLLSPRRLLFTSHPQTRLHDACHRRLLEPTPQERQTIRATSSHLCPQGIATQAAQRH